MPLFDVPGWSISADPVAEASTSASRKRKRPASDTGSDNKIHSAEVNLEKLVKKLTGKSSSRKKDASKVSKIDSPKSQRNRKRKDQKPKRNDEELKKSISLLMPLKAADKGGSSTSRPTKKANTKHESRTSEEIQPSSEEPEQSFLVVPMPLKAADKSGSSTSRPTKKAKTKHEPRISEEIQLPPEEPEQSSLAGLTAMQKSMKQSLDGARFRLINEKLYKSDSHEAHRMMRDEPVVYAEYHNGFRHQVRTWPTNPVDHYVSMLSKYAPNTVIADLGCGDAAIARALVPKGMTVLSFDLVSNNAYVVEADICGKLPLPGSEDSSKGEGHIVDVVVFSLSLMSTNWPQSIREAWRILKPDGELKIAEVASRFSNVEDFTTLVASCGFRLKSKDDRNTHFTLFEFKKISREPKTDEEWEDILARGGILKPCEYKRRCM